MPVTRSLTVASAAEPDRLHGWKEIATYLGRGVRTVQRWESELGLPVYRLVTKGSEVVYARRSDLDAWLNSTDRMHSGGKSDAPPEPSVLRRQVTRLDLGWAALAVALFVVLLMGYANNTPIPAWPFGSGASAPGLPVSSRFDHQRLQAFDALGNPVWEHVFDFPIDEGVYRTGFLADGQSPGIVVDDANGDGKPEVMLVPWAADAANRRFYCFGTSGTMLFAAPALAAVSGHLAGRAQEFNAGRFVVTGEAKGGKSIWLTLPHAYRTETIVQRLDGQGRVMAEYASGGTVSLLKALTLNGRHVMMVGGSSADLHAATLAVLDYADAAGVDPTRAAGHGGCEGCSTAGPIAFVAFPRLDVSTAVSRPATVIAAQLRADGGLDVSVLQARIGVSGDRPFTNAAVVYSFSPDFRLESTLVTEGYLLAHSELQLAGRITHPYGDEDRHTLLPLRAWQGSGFVPLSVGGRVPIVR